MFVFVVFLLQNLNENGFYQATGLELDSSDSRGPFLLQELQGTDNESLDYVVTVCSFSRSVLSRFVDVSDFFPVVHLK